MPSKKTDENGNYIFKWKEHTVMNILSNEKYKEKQSYKRLTQKIFSHIKRLKTAEEIYLSNMLKTRIHLLSQLEEWKCIQVEMKRRGKRYSSLSVFGSKIICGDCGSCYGQKYGTVQINTGR